MMRSYFTRSRIFAYIFIIFQKWMISRAAKWHKSSASTILQGFYLKKTTTWFKNVVSHKCKISTFHIYNYIHSFVVISPHKSPLPPHNLKKSKMSLLKWLFNCLVGCSISSSWTCTQKITTYVSKISQIDDIINYVIYFPPKPGQHVVFT